MQRRYLAALTSSLTVCFVLLSACGGNEATTTTTPRQTLATTTTVAGASAPTTVGSTTSTVVASTSTPAVDTTAGDSVDEVRIIVAEGIVVGGGRIPVTLGQEVRIIVEGDVTDEVHLHGYDVVAELTPDQPAVLEVVADVPGIFEVELEQARLPLGELLVEP